MYGLRITGFLSYDKQFVDIFDDDALNNTSPYGIV